jgi:hypothetical protein
MYEMTTLFCSPARAPNRRGGGRFFRLFSSLLFFVEVPSSWQLRLVDIAPAGADLYNLPPDAALVAPPVTARFELSGVYLSGQ